MTKSWNIQEQCQPGVIYWAFVKAKNWTKDNISAWKKFGIKMTLGGLDFHSSTHLTIISLNKKDRASKIS